VVLLVRLLGTVLCLLPGLVIAGPLLAGIQIYLGKRLLGLPATLDDVFKGFRRFKDTLLVGLVLYLVPFLISAMLAIPRILAIFAANHDSDHDLAGLLAVTTLLSGVGSLFTVAYLVLANTFLIFAMPLVVFRQMPALDAMRRSYELVKPQIPAFLVLLVVLYLVGAAGSSVGLILFCIGWLVTFPLTVCFLYLVELQAYREFVGLTPDDLAPYLS
jgi:hypothetical protein